jgi:hypothetical protein
MSVNIKETFYNITYSVNSSVSCSQLHTLGIQRQLNGYIFTIYEPYLKLYHLLGDNNLVVVRVCKLLLGVEDVDRPQRIVDDTGDVEALVLLSEGVNLSDLVGGELDIGEVLNNSGSGD